jgi:AhpD family alkylhydroperoxidase
MGRQPPAPAARNQPGSPCETVYIRSGGRRALTGRMPRTLGTPAPDVVETPGLLEGYPRMSTVVEPATRYPWYVRLLFRKQKQTYGQVLEPGRLWGRSPRVFAAVAMLYGALDRSTSPLSPALRSLVTVRVSQINHCAFCVDINSATLMKRGVAMEKIDALAQWRDSPLFSPEERLALEYAEAMTHPEPGVGDELRQRLKQLWDDDALIELTALIAFQNLSSKFNAALDVPPQGFCRLPGPGDAPRR